jgi:hypothetical protein
MAFIKVLTWEVAILGSFYAFMRYAGDFPTQQAAVLTIAALIVYELYGKLRARAVVDTFTPFAVSILPNWFQLLSDFRLIQGEEEWHRLQEEIDKLPISDYAVFRSGFLFTVIKAPSATRLLPGLTYWNNRKVFLSDVELSESVIEIKDDAFMPRIGAVHPFLRHPEWARLPEVYFKWGSGGYELGLEVQADWWKELCANPEMAEVSKIKSQPDHLCGTTRLVIATLPYSEFAPYYQDVPYNKMKKLQDEVNKQLASFDWKRPVERESEIRDPWSHIEHKYFTVAHREI